MDFDNLSSWEATPDEGVGEKDRSGQQMSRSSDAFFSVWKFIGSFLTKTPFEADQADRV